jgi:hypothetical protein
MCGVFGFVSYDGNGPSLKRLARIAKVTMSRARTRSGSCGWTGRTA